MSNVCFVRKTNDSNGPFFPSGHFPKVIMVGSTMIMNTTHGINVMNTCRRNKDVGKFTNVL